MSCNFQRKVGYLSVLEVPDFQRKVGYLSVLEVPDDRTLASLVLSF